MRRALTSDLGQLFRSWYMFAMQIPRLPEWGFRRNGFRSLARAMRRTSAPGTFTDAELDVYRQAWAQPGALTGMVNWYRAAVRLRPPIPRPPRVTVPTLLIWGGRDRFMKGKLAHTSIDFCDAGRLEYWPWVSHWVQHEEANRVNRLLEAFLRPGPAGGRPSPAHEE